MTTMHKKNITLFVLATTMIVWGNNAMAKDFKYRENLNIRSRVAGVGFSQIEMLERLPGPGMNQITQALLTQLSDRSDALSTDGKTGHQIYFEVDNFTVRDKEGRWKLKVWADGTRFSFRNEEYTHNKSYRKIPINQRFSNEELEKLGRDFIVKDLAKLVTISSDDEILPLRTEFEVERDATSSYDPTEGMVASAVVTFSRRVNGIDVVGSGSKIAVYVANDGEVIGFAVDWPNYKGTSEFQETLSASETLERLSTFGTTIIGADHVELRWFECGYYDAGVKFRDPNALVQAGCLAYTVGKIDTQAESGMTESMTAPFINVIPAGSDVEWDDNWPETWIITEKGDFCTETKLSACIGTSEVEIPKAQQ